MKHKKKFLLFLCLALPSCGSNSYNSSNSNNSTSTTSNSAPVIVGLPPTISVPENQISVVTVYATDADGDPLIYSLSGEDASLFTISSTGVLSFIDSPDYEAKHTYIVTIRVSDKQVVTSQEIIIYVKDLLEPVQPIFSMMLP